MTLRDRVQNGMSVQIDLSGDDLESLIELGNLAKADAFAPRVVAMKLQAFAGEAIRERKEEKSGNTTTVRLAVQNDLAAQIAAFGWILPTQIQNAEALGEAVLSILQQAIGKLCLNASGARPDGDGFALSNIVLTPQEMELLKLAGHVAEDETRATTITSAFRDLAMSGLLESIDNSIAGTASIHLKISQGLLNGLQKCSWLAYGCEDPAEVGAAIGRLLEYAVQNRGLSAASAF
ncbi:MAG: hypothetical protein WBX25_27255 [Rhodomicrobium sp.]